MSIITMLVLLSILILVHELGHFAVAKKLGIKVERFGFGLPFGPTLFEKKWGETTICIHAFLLGGYVSFPDDNPDSDVPKDDPSRIANKKVWERALVVSAGVTANAILAFLIVVLVAGASGKLPSGKFNVFADGIQKEKSYLNQVLNIQKGDKIFSANGVIIDSPYKFIELAQRSKKFDGYVTQSRVNSQYKKLISLNPNLAENKTITKGKTITLPKVSNEKPLSIEKNILLDRSEYIPEGQKLSEKLINLRNELENKESYISNGEYTLKQIAIATSDSVHPIKMTVTRKGSKIELPSVTPDKTGVIGIKLKTEQVLVDVESPLQVITASWDYLYRNVSYMTTGLVNIFTGKIPLGDLHGIVAITKIGGDIIQNRGIWDGLLLTALISIDLAIVNLLPIPALDGGHLMFLLIEKLRGRPVNEKVQETFAQYGFLLLIGLMVVIIFNDIFGILTDKF